MNFKIQNQKNKCKKRKTQQALLMLCFIFTFFTSVAQNISVTLDSTSIKIGEEAKLRILVNAKPTDLIVFPETKNMGLMEVINSYKIDTLNKNNQFVLKKEYGLTQFDSGHFTLPSQKIIIDGKPIYTDSLLIEVRDVMVDTTKQKLFDIKPIIEVEKPAEGIPVWVWYIVLGLLIIGLILYVFFFRKSKAEKELENKLPPFEEAIAQLSQLKENEEALLNEGKYKEYYTQLTDVLKHYLDEEVDADALESTSDELIEKLELLRDAEKLPISKEIIQKLKGVLQTSDLVKFAKSKPDAGTAKVDRNTIQNIITETKEAIPEPTEEELWLDEQYRLEQARIAKRKKIIYASITGLSLIILTGLGLGFKYGFTNIKDAVFAPESKQLLEGSWIRSEYGNPAIVINSPEVLKRTSNAQMEAMQTQSFAYGNLSGNLAIVLNTTQIPPTAQMGMSQASENEEESEEPAVDLEQVNEQTLQILEQQGATNVVVKQADYEFPEGVKGMKAYGTFTIENPITKQKQLSGYEIISFTQGKTIQQVMVFHKNDDQYAKQMAAKILESVELKKSEE